jgi:hypothetical protein
MPAEFLTGVAWASYASATATLVTFVTGILFFAVGQPWGTIQDAASALQVLLMLPIAWMLHRMLGAVAAAWSWLALIVGVLGMLVAGVLQISLVLRRVAYERTIGMVLGAGGAIGVWLLAVGGLALAHGLLPVGLAWAGIAAGMGYLTLVVGFWSGGQQHPVFWAGSLAALAGYAVWAVWLGWLVQTGAWSWSALL